MLLGPAIIAFSVFLILRKSGITDFLVGFKQYLLIGFIYATLEAITGAPSLWTFIKSWPDVFTPNISLVPFVEGYGLSDRFNIYLFIPIGVLLAASLNKGKLVWYVSLVGFCISLIIEVGQLFTPYRISDTTDLFSNTVGTFIGAVIYLLWLKLSKKERKNTISSAVLIKLLLIMFVVTFVF